MQARPDHGEETLQGFGDEGQGGGRDRADSGTGERSASRSRAKGADVLARTGTSTGYARETQKLVERRGGGRCWFRATCRGVDCRRVMRLRPRGSAGSICSSTMPPIRGKAVDKVEENSIRSRLRRTFRVNIEAMFHLVGTRSAWRSRGSASSIRRRCRPTIRAPGILDYATPKGAIVTFTKGLAQQLNRARDSASLRRSGPVLDALVVASSILGRGEDEHREGPHGGRPPWRSCPAYVFLSRTAIEDDQGVQTAGERRNSTRIRARSAAGPDPGEGDDAPLVVA